MERFNKGGSQEEGGEGSAFRKGGSRKVKKSVRGFE